MLRLPVQKLGLEPDTRLSGEDKFQAKFDSLRREAKPEGLSCQVDSPTWLRLALATRSLEAASWTREAVARHCSRGTADAISNFGQVRDEGAPMASALVWEAQPRPALPEMKTLFLPKPHFSP